MKLRVSIIGLLFIIILAAAVARCGPDGSPPSPSVPVEPPPPPPTGRSFGLSYDVPSTYIDGRPLTNFSHTKAVCRSLAADGTIYEVIVPGESPAGGGRAEARFSIDPFPAEGIECWAIAYTTETHSEDSEHIFWDGR